MALLLEGADAAEDMLQISEFTMIIRQIGTHTHTMQGEL
jgi:hypothetical protein